MRTIRQFLSTVYEIPVKKSAAVSLSLAICFAGAGAVSADAATNEMNAPGAHRLCTLNLDGEDGPIVLSQSAAAEELKDTVPTDKQTLRRFAADLGEALGSSKPERINDANNAEALQACLKGQDYKTAEMTGGKRAAIIITTVLSILIGIAGLASPFISALDLNLPF